MEADNKLECAPISIRNPPIFGFCDGVDPRVVAMECTTGKTIPPPRAVLLGTKGANSNSILHDLTTPTHCNKEYGKGRT